MNKEEIIKLLDKEIGLFKELEKEDSDGELYISELQFREIEIILLELKSLRKSTQDWKNQLREIVEGDKRFVVIKNPDLTLKDKVISLPFPLIFLCEQALISNNIFNEIKTIK